MKMTGLSLKAIKNNVIPSALTAAFVGMAFFTVRAFDSAILLTSLGASAFIALFFPSAQSAKARLLIGGYACGGIWGCAMSLIRQAVFPGGIILLCAAAVFLTSLSMSALDVKHPPSVALAISITISDSPTAMCITAILCILSLCFVKEVAAKLFYRETEDN